MTTMTTVEVLRTARGLIDTPDKWSESGWGWDGVRRCAVQAIVDADPSCDRDCTSSPAYYALRRALGGNVGEFNDAHSHAEVLALFDKAIATEEAKS